MSKLVKLINNVPNGNTYSGILKTDTDTGLFFGSKNGNLKTDISRLSVMIDSTRYYIGFIDKSQNNDIVINDSLTLPECGETEIDVEEILHFYKPSGLFVSNLAEDSVFIYEKLFNLNGETNINLALDGNFVVIKPEDTILLDKNNKVIKLQVGSSLLNISQGLKDKYGNIVATNSGVKINSCVDNFSFLYEGENLSSFYWFNNNIVPVTWINLKNIDGLFCAKCLVTTIPESYKLMTDVEFASANSGLPVGYTRPQHSFSVYLQNNLVNEVAWYSDKKEFVSSSKEFEVRDNTNGTTIFKVNKDKGYIKDKGLVTKDLLNKVMVGLSNLKNLNISDSKYDEEENKYVTTKSLNLKFNNLQNILNEIYLKIKGLVPKKLDSLEKIANAINNDDKFAETVDEKINIVNSRISSVSSGSVNRIEFDELVTEVGEVKTLSEGTDNSLKLKDISLENRIFNIESVMTVVSGGTEGNSSFITNINNRLYTVEEETIPTLQTQVDMIDARTNGITVSTGFKHNGKLVKFVEDFKNTYVDDSSIVKAETYIVNGEYWEVVNLTYDKTNNNWNRTDISKCAYAKVTKPDGNDPLDTVRDGMVQYIINPGANPVSLGNFIRINQFFGNGDTYFKGNLEISKQLNLNNENTVISDSGILMCYNAVKTDTGYAKIVAGNPAYAIKLNTNGTITRLYSNSMTFTTWTSIDVITDDNIDNKLASRYDSVGTANKLVRYNANGTFNTTSYDNDNNTRLKRYFDLALNVPVDNKPFALILVPVSSGNVAKSRVTGTFTLDRGGTSASMRQSYIEIDIGTGYGSTNIINKVNTNLTGGYIATVMYGGSLHYAFIFNKPVSTFFTTFNGLWKTTSTAATIPTIVSDYSVNGVTEVTPINVASQIHSSKLTHTFGLNYDLLSSEMSVHIKKDSSDTFVVKDTDNLELFKVNTYDGIVKTAGKDTIRVTGTSAGTLLTIGTAYNRSCVVRITGQNYDGKSLGVISEYIINNVEGTSVSINEITNFVYGSTLTPMTISLVGSGQNTSINVAGTTLDYVLTIEITGIFTII